VLEPWALYVPEVGALRAPRRQWGFRGSAQGDGRPGSISAVYAHRYMAHGLSVTGLHHSFGERVALDNIDFSVSGGEIVGLVGRNGAGKTTAMRAIMGIIKPKRGTIRWEGHPVDLDDRRRFGYMPEERGLYPQMRLFEQVTYFGRIHGLDSETAKSSAHRLLQRLRLQDRELDKIVALSHGNQQRAQLAVALTHEPPLAILDEPFSGLDPEAVDDLSKYLRDTAAKGTAVLLSSHQLELVERLCDRTVILDRGRVLAQGTLAELRERQTRRLRVHVEAPPNWVKSVPGVKVISEDADGLVLVLEPHVDPQAILRAAQVAGPVDHFAFEAGSLADLYRELLPS